MSTKQLDMSFEEAKWIRESEETVFEKRPARIEDFKGTGVYTIGGTAIDFANSTGDKQALWKYNNPKYQDILDGYIMKRIYIRLTVTKECSTGTSDRVSMAATLALSSLNYYMSGQSTTGVTIPITIGNMTSSGQYMIESIRVSDNKNSISKTTLIAYGYTPWELIKTNVNIT